MKLLIAGLLCLLALPSAHADTEFSCGSDGHGVAFRVEFDGARYADSVHIGYLEKDMKQFLRADEQNLETGGENLNLAATIGTCKKNTAGGPVLVSCELGPHAWILANYEFGYNQELSPKWSQYVQIRRQMDVHRLSLKVSQATAIDPQTKKEKKIARLELKIVGDLAHAKNKEISISRELGSLDQDWYMCQFK